MVAVVAAAAVLTSETRNVHMFLLYTMYIVQLPFIYLYCWLGIELEIDAHLLDLSCADVAWLLLQAVYFCKTFSSITNSLSRSLTCSHISLLCHTQTHTVCFYHKFCKTSIYTHETWNGGWCCYYCCIILSNLNVPYIQWQLFCSSFSFCRVSSQIVNFQLLLQV